MQAPDADKKPLAELCKEPLEVGPAPSTRWLREQELELRALLLRDAQYDDGIMREWSPQWDDAAVGDHPLSLIDEGYAWCAGLALGELRLVERRLHQMGEP